MIALKSKLEAALLLGDGNAKVFQQLVSLAMQTLQLTDYEVADEFECIISTVKRWRLGYSHPHPVLMPSVYKFFIKEINKHLAISRPQIIHLIDRSSK